MRPHCTLISPLKTAGKKNEHSECKLSKYLIQQIKAESSSLRLLIAVVSTAVLSTEGNMFDTLKTDDPHSVSQIILIQI